MSASRVFPWRRNEANTSLKSTRDFPWRRNVATSSATTEQVDDNSQRTHSKLSAEACEFVPSYLKDPEVREVPQQAVTASDGNCSLVSFDGYSDDDSDEEASSKSGCSKPALPVAPRTSFLEKHAAISEGHVEEKRPWRRVSRISDTSEIDKKSFVSISHTLSTETTISVASTCATPSSSMTQSSSASSADNSSISSESGDSQEHDSDCVFSSSDLLRFRHAVDRMDGNEIHLDAQLVPEPHTKEVGTSNSERMESNSKSLVHADGFARKLSSHTDKALRNSNSEGPRTEGAKTKLKVSEGSWVARQQARRKSAEVVSDEEVARKMKSILNKLTVETFPKLSKQLTSGDIRTAAQLEILIHEIFEKATTQHHFINLYADLCSMLQAHFAQLSTMDDPKMNFKKILLGACQASFERHLSPPASLKSLEGEELAAAEQLYKVQMLGNIRFVGALLVRKMLATKVMFAIVEELLGGPTPEALESLAALCTVVGPTFDNQDYAAFSLQFKAIFDQMKVLTSKPDIKLRIRCLLKDVLELRACGWRDQKPQKIEGPSTLEEVAQKFHAEASVDAARAVPCRRVQASTKTEWNNVPSSHEAVEKSTRSPHVTRLASDLFTASSSGEPARLSLQPRKRKEKANEEPFDKEACRKAVSGAYTELKVSQDVQEAVTRVAAVSVPLSMQSEELCALLVCIVEESSAAARKAGFKLVVTIFAEGRWNPAALEDGMQNFKSTCDDLVLDVPALSSILREEMCSAFEVLVKRDILPARCLQAFASF